MSSQPMHNSETQSLGPDIRAVEVRSIIVGDRHRHDFGDLQGLADSIAEIGLLQPIGITADRVLVFGERRLRAVRDLLHRDQIEVRVVDVPAILLGEYAENEIRKDFTPSERVAIAGAVRRALGERQGQRTDRLRDGGPEVVEGRSRDVAARRAGFDSGRQLDRASNVIRLGVPALVEAMDRGSVSISAAEAIARQAPSEQATIAALPEPARIEEMRRRKQEATRLRAAAAEQEQTTGPTAYTGFLKKNGRLPDEAEARTIASLDQRETPTEGGGRAKPAAAPTSKEGRARKKLVDGYGDELWRTQQAVQLLELNTTDPAILMEHVSYIERGILDQKLRAARAWLNRFAREYRKHVK